MLTGSFRESPKDLYIDPDFKSLKHAKWIALRHVDTHADVEARFNLPRGSLRDRASLESSWSHGEYQGSEDQGNPHRVAGKTNDLVVWYEIFSKCGPGSRLTGMDQTIKERLAALQNWALQQEFPTLEQAVDHVFIPLTNGGATCQ